MYMSSICAIGMVVIGRVVHYQNSRTVLCQCQKLTSGFMNWTKKGVFIEYPCCSKNFRYIQQGLPVLEVNHMNKRALAPMMHGRVGTVLYLEKTAISCPFFRVSA